MNNINNVNLNTPINGINKNKISNNKKYIKSYNMTLDDYLSELYINNIFIQQLIISHTKNNHKIVKKINEESFIIPKFCDYMYLINNNYNLHQLKVISKEYKLKVSGNKQQLTNRILCFLFFSNKIIKIQSIARRYLQQKYNKSHGPAFNKKSICVNTYDFLSMEDLNEIPYYQFFSYKDEDDGLIYGFDLLSFYNLLYKMSGPVKNPFNRKSFTPKIIQDFRSLIRLSRLFKIPITTEIRDEISIVEQTQEQSLETRIITLFHNIDLLGNYSQSEWFTTLNRIQLIKLMRELLDIWQYRAPLSFETKRNICPPTGNPFINFNFSYVQNLDSITEIRIYILNILEKFINSGIDRDSKMLGAFYVLGAFTLVNNDAATALPWLYQSVCYN